MPITLPSLPLGSQTQVSLQSNALDLKPTFGGPVQRASRLGDRWGIDVTCRPMRYDQGMTFIADLVRGMSEKVVMDFPQPGLTIGSPGTPRVNGAGQLGTTLVADGFSANYAIQKGQFFSIVHNGVRYLHQVSAAVTANGSGAATLAIFPMLRVSPADNSLLEFATPKIEGWLQGGGKQGWTISLVQSVGLSFSIMEGE